MDELSLKKKIAEWLALKAEAEALSKAKMDKNFDIGTSNISLTPEAPAGIHHTHEANQLSRHKPMIKDIAKDESGVHQPKGAHGRSGLSLLNDVANIIPKDHPHKEFYKQKARKEVAQHLSQLKSMPKPNLPKTEKAEMIDALGNKPSKASSGSSRMGVVGGVGISAGFGKSELRKDNKYLKDMIHTMKEEKAQRKAKELAAFKQKAAPIKPSGVAMPAQVGKVPTLHDPDMSGKVDYKKVNKAQVIPNLVSEPSIANRLTVTEPKVIQSPNTMNPYSTKNIISALKNRKRG